MRRAPPIIGASSLGPVLSSLRLECGEDTQQLHGGVGSSGEILVVCGGAEPLQLDVDLIGCPGLDGLADSLPDPFEDGAGFLRLGVHSEN